MKLVDLLKNIPLIEVSGNDREDILGLAYSSKQVKVGFLFAALKGGKTDGFEFIGDAVGRGARAVLSENPKPENVNVVWVRVPDAREALACLAAAFYSFPSRELKVVGITGTKGKTTVTYLLESILRKAGFEPSVIGTINYRGPDMAIEADRTTPEAPDIQRLLREFASRGATHCLIEVSSHALDLKRVWGVEFDAAVFTNLSGEHMDYHHSMEDYFAAKKKLFFLNSKKRTAVVNLDDPWGQKLLAELPMATVSFGLEPAAIVRSKVYRLNEEGITAEIDYPGGQVEITSPLMGKHNLSNILASFAVSLVLNVPVAAIQQGLASLQNVPGRMEKIENNRGFQIFIDYAHTDNALKNLLETVRGLRPGRILLVFGAGGDRDKSKRERMGEAAGRLADLIFITSDNPRSEDPMAIIAEIEKGVKKSGAKNYRKIEDRREAIEQALRAAKKGDYVLVAGKGHEPYQIAKDKVLPFHDGEVIRNILTKLEHK